MSPRQQRDVMSEYEKDCIAWNLPLPRVPQPAGQADVTQDVVEPRSEGGDTKASESAA